MVMTMVKTALTQSCGRIIETDLGASPVQADSAERAAFGRSL